MIPNTFPIEFTPWTSWGKRASLRRTDGPWLGLYLWARLHPSQPPGIPYPDLPEAVIYVGEAKNLDRRPLAGRHHRLDHYRATFPDDHDLQHLYLSVCRLYRFSGGYATDEALKLYPSLRVYTQFLEAQLYWDYTKRWGRPPALHYKKSRDAGVPA